jgi:hypothetical protein
MMKDIEVDGVLVPSNVLFNINSDANLCLCVHEKSSNLVEISINFCC